MELEAEGACLGASCHGIENLKVTSLDTFPMAVRMHMHGRLKVTTLTFGGGKKHSPWGSEEGWGAQTESPGSGMEPAPFSRREVGPTGLIQRLQ